MVITVLLKLAFTWATPDVMFFFSRRRTRAWVGLAMSLLGPAYYYVPAIALAGP
jgi:hypothetical protein